MKRMNRRMTLMPTCAGRSRRTLRGPAVGNRTQPQQKQLGRVEGLEKLQNIWLPDMDLNHDKQIQSLLCYRYTIGQSGAADTVNNSIRESSC